MTGSGIVPKNCCILFIKWWTKSNSALFVYVLKEGRTEEENWDTIIHCDLDLRGGLLGPAVNHLLCVSWQQNTSVSVGWLIDINKNSNENIQGKWKYKLQIGGERIFSGIKALKPEPEENILHSFHHWWGFAGSAAAGCPTKRLTIARGHFWS